MTIGLIGCGKMGSALTLGAIKAGVFKAEDVLAYDPVPAAIDSMGDGIRAAASLEDAVSGSDVLLLCVKPYQIHDVLQRVAELNSNSGDLLAISIAAGVTIDAMEKSCQKKARIIRCMPNTPALVGQGAAAFALGSDASPEDASFAQNLLGSVGLAYEVTENLIDSVTGVSGSGPAYVYTFIEALADGGLLEGLPRDQALALATQTVLGAATMVAESGEHPALLRDRVTSPGGTTIAALATLEEGAFRSTTIKAVRTAAEKARELGQ
ncbi:MAG: pyrroline-5-carboxylate reductase [Akkermansiaceae bacterium]|jgi:pyrroline-5-carboxylate reductase